VDLWGSDTIILQKSDSGQGPPPQDAGVTAGVPRIVADYAALRSSAGSGDILTHAAQHCSRVRQQQISMFAS
jgi:hypothetical protein